MKIEVSSQQDGDMENKQATKAQGGQRKRQPKEEDSGFKKVELKQVS